VITYTVWSRGRELGHSSLAFARCLDSVRAGWFYPTDAGTSLMRIITGSRDAWLAMAVAYQQGKHEDLSEEEWRRTAEFAGVVAAAAHADALQLELRGPDGRVIPTEDIDIRDTELFIPEIHGDNSREEIPLDDLSPQSRKDLEELLEFAEGLREPEPWEPVPEMGRYRLFVHLENEWDIP